MNCRLCNKPIHVITVAGRGARIVHVNATDDKLCKQAYRRKKK